jgi:acylphosphatase
MRRVEILVKGRVQRVGYRDEVEELARRLEIAGFIENVKPYDVRIVAEGDDEALEQFIERLQIKRCPIEVERVEVRVEEFTGEYSYFEIKRGDLVEELGERLDFAGRLLYRSVELGEQSVALGERSVELTEQSVALGERSVELTEQSVTLGERSVELSEQSVTLGERSVELSEQSVALGERTATSSEDSVSLGNKALEKHDETTKEIKGLREDLKSYMEERFDQLEHEVTAIKAKLGMV